MAVTLERGSTIHCMISDGDKMHVDTLKMDRQVNENAQSGLYTNLQVENTDKCPKQINKSDWATMRPGCVLVCIDHVTYVWRLERQMDEQMGEMTLKHVG